MQARLPEPADAERPVVVLRLRGRAMLGSTAFAVLSDYADRLAAAGGRLYLTGVDPAVLHQLRRNRTVEQVDVSRSSRRPTWSVSRASRDITPYNNGCGRPPDPGQPQADRPFSTPLR